jgi:hypothetical protein
MVAYVALISSVQRLFESEMRNNAKKRKKEKKKKKKEEKKKILPGTGGWIGVE